MAPSAAAFSPCAVLTARPAGGRVLDAAAGRRRPGAAAAAAAAANVAAKATAGKDTDAANIVDAVTDRGAQGGGAKVVGPQRQQCLQGRRGTGEYSGHRPPVLLAPARQHSHRRGR